MHDGPAARVQRRVHDHVQAARVEQGHGAGDDVVGRPPQRVGDERPVGEGPGVRARDALRRAGRPRREEHERRVIADRERSAAGDGRRAGEPVVPRDPGRAVEADGEGRGHPGRERCRRRVGHQHVEAGDPQLGGQLVGTERRIEREGRPAGQQSAVQGDEELRPRVGGDADPGPGRGVTAERGGDPPGTRPRTAERQRVVAAPVEHHPRSIGIGRRPVAQQPGEAPLGVRVPVERATGRERTPPAHQRDATVGHVNRGGRRARGRCPRGSCAWNPRPRPGAPGTPRRRAATASPGAGSPW